MSAKRPFLTTLESGLATAGIRDGSTLIVAFSGGPDSSALLAGLGELSTDHELNLIALHVEHSIRPDAATSDLAQVTKMAEQFGIELEMRHVNAPEFATIQNISIESAARILRYKELNSVAEIRNADAVATGHTLDDQAETVLLHAARGAGLKGLTGMAYSSQLQIPGHEVDLPIARPMLDVTHDECVAYCQSQNIDYVVDESNTSRDYTRNKIRLDVLPGLNAAIPGSTQALARLAQNASDDFELIDWITDRHLDRANVGDNEYSRAALVDLPSPLIARLLMKAYERHTLHSLDLERGHVSDMIKLLEGNSGKSIDLPNDIVLYVDKSSFGFRGVNDDDCPYPQPLTRTKSEIPGAIHLDSGFQFKLERISRPLKLNSGNLNLAYASPELSSHELELRNRKDGDRIQPLGMENTVKLQDLFVDAGVPARWRDRIPIVDSPSGIVWIPGHRLADWAKVLPEHDEVIRMELVGSRS